MTTPYEIVMATMVIFLLGALGWSVVLRRKVKEQTEQIRCQLLREVALEKQFKELFENANDVIFSLDSSGVFTSLNRSGEKILGYSQKQAQTFSLRELVAPEQRELFDRWMTEICKEQHPPIEVNIIPKGGGGAILEVNARPIMKEGIPAGLEGIARDITL